MQATVLSFDPQTGAGSVVDDDGRIAEFDGSAFVAGGLRLLRPGQRVRAVQADMGRIVAVTILTLPDLPGVEYGAADLRPEEDDPA